MVSYESFSLDVLLILGDVDGTGYPHPASNILTRAIMTGIRLVYISATRRNICRLSTTTRVSGMVGNSGGCDTLYLLVLDEARAVFSSVVLAPKFVSVIDHCCDESYRSMAGHLHQMHAWVAVAESMPVIMAKNFQSPPRKYVIVRRPGDSHSRRNNEHPESLTTTTTTKPRGRRWPTFRT